MISETQEETIRVCSDCSGLLTIDSRTDAGCGIFAIHIPRNACDACRQAGYKAYDSTGSHGYNGIFLQDRTCDQYLKKVKGEE